MTKAELLREIGVHLKKVVDMYNQLAKNPNAFTPGEIDILVNNAAKIIEFAAVIKHQPASAINTDEQVRLRDLEDKLRVINEQLKAKEFEIDRLNKANEELEKKVEEHKHLADAFSVSIPEINEHVDTNSTIAKNDLLESTLINKVEEPVEETKEIKMDSHNPFPPSAETLVEDKKMEPIAEKLNLANDNPSTIVKKTVPTMLHESVIDGSKENIADKMMNGKVDDLKKSIPLHDKFHYTNELFAKNGEHYSQFLDAMNTKTNWKEAEALLAQAASMYKWDPENKTALQFIALIQRRFN